ncbi:type 2A phosphatase activator TIP41 [Paragonimus westermani]|uniref:TIP41-like protein n=1 Tax=Paragonimus westermani TaxID=34504 RepID=A0A5J4NN32_9TREM|nr:type 2A phosphatase activator TIP41 [Paragonimus westermani]
MEDHVAIRCTDPKVSKYSMDDWHVSVTEHHILKSRGIEREVPVANSWRQARIGAEEQVDHPKPYDWTFTTSYTGTLTGTWSVQPHKEGLDLSLLQRRDPILFYAETMLFEDELGDNGVAMLSVRFRAMATGFFLLQRFFLRVDGGLVRVYDTRLQWRKSDDYLIRDVRQMESSSWQPSMVGVCLMEADRVCDKLIQHRCEKLFPTA